MHPPSSPIRRFQFHFLHLLLPPSLLSILHLLLSSPPSPLSPPLSFPTMSSQLVQGPYSLLLSLPPFPSPSLPLSFPLPPFPFSYPLSPFPFPSPFLPPSPFPFPLSHFPLCPSRTP